MKRLNTMLAAHILGLAAAMGGEAPIGPRVYVSTEKRQAKSQADFAALANAEKKRQRRNAKRARKGTT
jgi:hypothetical protein